MNTLDVTIVREPGYVVVRTDGYINHAAGQQIKQEIELLIQQGCGRFILNFARSPVINSTGLSMLIGLIERMLDVQGILIFTDLTELNAETIESMGLTQYVHLLPTEEEARSFIAQARPSAPRAA